jgi:NitT/TauT family transport system permease protein
VTAGYIAIQDDEGATAERGAPQAISAPRSRRRSVDVFLTRVLPVLVVFCFVTGFWSFISYALIGSSRRFLFPPPLEVLSVGVLTWTNFRVILVAALLTARVAVVGFAIAVVLGTVLAVLMAQAKWIERSLFPYAVVLQTIPMLALVPVIGFSIGFSFRSRVLVCTVISIFPIITNVLFGLKSVESNLQDLFTLQRASRWTRLRQLQGPAALPSFFTGLRISAGASVVGAIVGDFFFQQGEPGIGALIYNYSQELQSDQLFTAVIISSLLGVLAFTVIGVVAHRVLHAWHESELSTVT